MTDDVRARVELQHDGTVSVATGASRHETQWKNRQVLWSELVRKLQQPTRTQETTQQYDGWPREMQVGKKDQGGFVGGALKGGRRIAANVAMRQLICLDLDHGDGAGLEKYLASCSHGYVWHSTRKDRPGKPRVRLVIPTDRPMRDDEYPAVARWIGGQIGIESLDDTTFEAHRLMFWPSVSSDQEFRVHVEDAPWLQVDSVLAKYGPDDAWKDQARWPVSDRLSKRHKSAAAKAGEPTDKPGLIGAFCRLYSISEAIESFLPDIYTPILPRSRYTYAGGTSAGGLVVYEDKWAYSHHSTDPACDQLCNAWDLVRLHKFGALDEDIAEDVPVNKRPSAAEMARWAGGLPAIREAQLAERLGDAAQEFTAAGSGLAELVEQLELDSKGRPLPTRRNLMQMISADPALRGRLRWNLMMQAPEANGPMPWSPAKGSRRWGEVDDAGLRAHVETVWKIPAPAAVVRDAMLLAAHKDQYHPVQDYLRGLTWDGTPRLDDVLIKFLGADDCQYTKAVTRKFLIGAVARAMEPGCQMDYMLTLVSPQGLGKSSLAQALGGRWASDSVFSFKDKAGMEAVNGVWFVEVAELTATKRDDVEGVKHFLSKRIDRYRPAYGHYIEEFPRQCVFIGSTNNRTVLSDATGNRRFWMVPVTKPMSESDKRDFDAIRDQLFAEALVYWAEGEKPYLSDELEAIAREVQEEHRHDSGLAGRIEAWLSEPVPADWYSRPLESRLKYIRDRAQYGITDNPEGADTIIRDRAHAMEVWLECLGGQQSNYSQHHARVINDALLQIGWVPTARAFFGTYGRQRGYLRPTGGEPGNDCPF